MRKVNGLEYVLQNFYDLVGVLGGAVRVLNGHIVKFGPIEGEGFSGFTSHLLYTFIQI